LQTGEHADTFPASVGRDHYSPHHRRDDIRRDTLPILRFTGFANIIVA
jgi:hypothetical protein